MAAATVKLKEAKKLEITSLMDNTVDFLSSSNRTEVQSLWQWAGRSRSEMPFAEHGFSMLIRVFSDKKVHSILFDTGISPEGVVENAKRMGLDLGEVDYVVLSHGHYDHFGGLNSALKTINKEDLPLVTHEDMFKRRGTKGSKGEIHQYPPFPKTAKAHSKIINTTNPLLIASDLACVTGEIPRTVEFEKGLTNSQIFSKGTWQPDPLIADERAIVFNVKSKGLVVISGCAHAGIINTLKYAQQIVGVKEVYAVLGGFHLAGKEFEKRIEPTVEMLKQFSPKMIVPSHCTGWRALHRIHQEFQDTFVSNSVGNRYLL
ncbi:MAG: MBL fold metallo-hydrolase [Candidatus Bathyarchaeota archaeon]|nr:MBL fold metallo-hydrolase [Candidatus Bathyarchaeota archaeon]